MRSNWPMEGLGALLLLFVAFGGAWGWVLNIMKLAEAGSVTGMVLVRAIGVVVPPLGAILGWIG